jgi:hypothetical protein
MLRHRCSDMASALVAIAMRHYWDTPRAQEFFTGLAAVAPIPLPAADLVVPLTPFLRPSAMRPRDLRSASPCGVAAAFE